ncbi:uncharacterized protein LOC111134981 [Crassostrea virginica]
MQSLKFVVAVVCIAFGFHEAQAAYGGGSCAIPSVGTNPGASGTCTGTANGFCLLDHLTVTGAPVTGINFDGVCICYPGYSGTSCATADSTTTTSSSTSTSNTNTAIAAIALGGLGAYFLSQLGSGQNALGLGSGSPQSAQEALYLQQATGGGLGGYSGIGGYGK